MRLKSKRDRLGAKGWRFGSAEEFLGLSDEENGQVELRLRLADRFPAEPAGAQAARLSARELGAQLDATAAKSETSPCFSSSRNSAST
jgi:hypothetical protein